MRRTNLHENGQVQPKRKNPALHFRVRHYLGNTVRILPGIAAARFGAASVHLVVQRIADNDLFHTVHRSAGMVLFLLAAVHIAAVVRHHRQGRKIMARMI